MNRRHSYFDRVDVDFANAVTITVAREPAFGVTDPSMLAARSDRRLFYQRALDGSFNSISQNQLLSLQLWKNLPIVFGVFVSFQSHGFIRPYFELCNVTDFY